jgi:O-antigen/teichoic acid export membrane protein
VGFALLGNEFVHLWLGDGFQSVYIVTLCIITPYVVILPEEIGRTVLYIENKIKYRAYAYLIALIVALLVGSIGQMWYGAQGAAFGVLVGSTVYIIVINIVYRKIARLDVASFFKSCYLSLSVPVFISAVVVCLINNYIQANSFIVLAVKGVIYLIVYLCLCWLFAFNQYEKDLVAGFAKVIPHRTR